MEGVAVPLGPHMVVLEDLMPTVTAVDGVAVVADVAAAVVDGGIMRPVVSI